MKNGGHVKNNIVKVFQILGGPQSAQWFWMVTRFGAVAGDCLPRPMNRDGFCGTKELAQAAAEEAYLGEAGR